ncbi:MAG: V-type ATP synthase subunit A, partial [Candidatus Thermoplasmatota archaeon]
LPAIDRVILEGARIIREDFLQQNAYHEIDTYCPPKKQYEMLRIIIKFYNLMKECVEKGIDFEKLKNLKSKEIIARMATTLNEEWEKRFKEIEKYMEEEIEKLKKA